MTTRPLAVDDSTGQISATNGAPAGALICRQHAAYTLTSTTAFQQLFNASANGRLTLPVGTYRFNCMYSLSSMASTTGNGTFGLGGSATLANVLWYAIGRDGSANVFATVDGFMSTAAAGAGAATNMHTGQAATSVQDVISGTFEVTVAGTLIPQFSLLTAAAAVVAAGSFFECWYIGPTTLATIGAWD